VGGAVGWWPLGELGQSYRSQQGLTAADHLEWGYPSAEELLCRKKHVRFAPTNALLTTPLCL